MVSSEVAMEKESNGESGDDVRAGRRLRQRFGSGARLAEEEDGEKAGCEGDQEGDQVYLLGRQGCC